MDKTYFYKKCEELCLAIGCDEPNNLTLDEYYKKFHNIRDSRFDEIIEALKDGSKYKRFPLIWDFKQAQSGTVTPQNPVFDEDEPIDREEYSRDLMALVEKFKPKKEGGYKPKKRDQLYTEKMNEEMVWSYSKYKWVHKSLMGNIGGHFLIPEDELKKIDKDGMTVKSV